MVRVNPFPPLIHIRLTCKGHAPWWVYDLWYWNSFAMIRSFLWCRWNVKNIKDQFICRNTYEFMVIWAQKGIINNYSGKGEGQEAKMQRDLHLRNGLVRCCGIWEKHVGPIERVLTMKSRGGGLILMGARYVQKIDLIQSP